MQTLTWDPEGHLATQTINSQTTSYIYDAFGNRLLRKDPDGTVTAYLNQQEIKKAPAGTLTATRFYADIATRTTTGLTWTATDHNGTAQLGIDATTLAVTTRRFTPFGDTRTTATWPSQHGYLDGTTDPTGLTHLGAREYDPTTGRFLSTDPLVDLARPQQWNPYAYSENDPITNADPSGLIDFSGEGGDDAGGGGSSDSELFESLDDLADDFFNGGKGDEQAKDASDLAAQDAADAAAARTANTRRQGRATQARTDADTNLESRADDRAEERLQQDAQTKLDGNRAKRVHEDMDDEATEPNQPPQTKTSAKGPGTTPKTGKLPQVTISRSRYPQSAAHVEDAQEAGKPSTVTIDRGGAAARRRAALGGTPRIPGMDRDEYPPAIFEEGGEGSSVRGVMPGDNRGAGASMGAQCRGLPDGTVVTVIIGC